MERCPTCNARYSGKRYCRRCDTDLGQLADMENRAKEHFRKAVSYLASEEYGKMLFHARRSCSLRRTGERDKLLACAAVLNGKFALALSLRNRYRRS